MQRRKLKLKAKFESESSYFIQAPKSSAVNPGSAWGQPAPPNLYIDVQAGGLKVRVPAGDEHLRGHLVVAAQLEFESRS